MSEETEGVPVFACARSDWTKDEKSIGRAASDREALRMIKKVLSERDGSDYELSVRDIVYSRSINGYCIED